MQRRSFVAGLVTTGLVRATSAFAQADPLPSWNDGPVKRAILDFVPRVTTAGSRDLVPVPERIACFDNDGTLWTEQPNYFQVIFASDRAKALAARHPEWKTLEPFKWVLEDNRAALAAMGEKGVLEIMVATHAGLTTEEFRQAVLDWLATARHPRFKGLVHHTDAVREYAYDRQSPIGRLDKAWDEAVRRGWSVVDMKADWKVIYPFEVK